MEDINYQPIANKLTELIKKRILQLNLIKTGAMYRSINVKPDGNGTFDVEAVHYFKYNDGRFNITDYVFASKEFEEFFEQEMYRQMTEGFNKLI